MCTDRKGNLPIHLVLHSIERNDGPTLESMLRVARKLVPRGCESVVKLDESGRLPIQLVVESPVCSPQNPHSIELVTLLGVPFSCDGEATNWGWLLQHNDAVGLARKPSVATMLTGFARQTSVISKRSSRFGLPSLQDAAHNGSDYVDAVLDRCDQSGIWKVEQLAHATDQHGRVALSIANVGNRKRLWKRLLFLGRYMELETLHQSATSVVIRVEDKEGEDEPPQLGAKLFHSMFGLGRLDKVVLDGPPGKPYLVIFDSGESRHYNASSLCKMKVVGSKRSAQTNVLALKRMTNEDEFKREIAIRTNWALSPEFVVAIACVHGPERAFTMECAECSLFDALSKEHFAGIDQFAVVATARSLARCIEHLHSLGIAHCDLKPRNFVRIGSVWKLIDFDAACRLGERAGMKYSTAYAPPELVCLLFRPMMTASELKNTISGKQFERDNESCAARRRENDELIMRMLQQLALVDRIEANGIDLMERTIEACASFDVWSFGVIMYHMLTGGQLFHR
jgi:hypothetical protein